MTPQLSDERVPDHLHRWLEAAQGAVERELQAALATQIDQIGLRRLRILQLVRPEGVRQQELADVASVAKQSLAESIAVLEADGLVERRVDPRDKRAWLVMATPAGRRVQATLNEALTDVEDRVARAVGARRFADFREVLRVIALMDSGVGPTKRGTYR